MAMLGNRTFARAVLSVTAAISLSACKSEVALSIYASDVEAALAGATDRTATAIIGVEAIRCAERGPVMLPAAQTGFPDAAFIGCRDAGLEVFAEYRARVWLLKIDREKPVAGTMSVALASFEGKETVALLYIDPDRVQGILDALPDELKYSLGGELLPKISFRMHNDTAADWTFSAQGVFVDGAAKQLPTDITLGPREETVVQLSDVGNAAIRGNRPILFYMVEK